MRSTVEGEIALLKNVAPPPRSGTVRKARRLRRDMSLPEVLLWRELRQRPGGLKFRRQHGSGSFVLDFYCLDARLAIEVDGEVHDRGDRPFQDAARDLWFAEAGIATMRITARDVLADVGAVVAHVVKEARSRLPHHHPASPGGPLPRDELGED